MRIGAGFLPLLAVTLLVLNGKTAWVGERFRNSMLSVVVLVAALVFFVVAGTLEVIGKF